MKLIVIGIDGGELNFIKDNIDYLPNTKKVMDEGVYNEMESTIPPITCPAWPCMFTGLNPADLGMYYFVDMADTFKVFTYADWQEQALWNRYNGSVGLFNIPMTYPPGEVNGYMISGLGTPAGARNIVYPVNINMDMPHDYWVQAPAVLTSRGHEREYAKVFGDDVIKKVMVAKKLLDDKPQDLNIFVFNTTDQASHYFWHHNDQSHPRYINNSGWGHIVRTIYEVIDSFVGHALGKCDKLMIVSDHGFQPFKKCLNINRWLEGEGYLKYNAPNGKNGGHIKRLIRNYLVAKLGAKNANTVASKMPEWLRKKLSTIEEERRSEENLLDTLDMTRTVAYSYGISAGIYVKGDNGLIDEIQAKLKQYITSKGLNGAIHKRMDIYQGRYADKAPSLVIEADSWYPSTLGYNELWPEPFTAGMHRKYGVYMAQGIAERANKIYEIAPIILKNLGG